MAYFNYFNPRLVLDCWQPAVSIKASIEYCARAKATLRFVRSRSGAAAGRPVQWLGQAEVGDELIIMTATQVKCQVFLNAQRKMAMGKIGVSDATSKE